MSLLCAVTLLSSLFSFAGKVEEGKGMGGLNAGSAAKTACLPGHLLQIDLQRQVSTPYQ